jgi:hypothetical protein
MSNEYLKHQEQKKSKKEKRQPVFTPFSDINHMITRIYKLKHSEAGGLWSLPHRRAFRESFAMLFQQQFNKNKENKT